MKKTARKHPWTSRPEVRDFIDHHENTQLDDRYHRRDDYHRDYHHRGRDDFRRRGRGDNRRYRDERNVFKNRDHWDERNRSQSRDQRERSRSRDYHHKKSDYDYDRNRRSHSRNRTDKHRDDSHYRSRSNSGTDSNKSNGISSVTDSESQGSPVRSWLNERKDSKNGVDSKNILSEVGMDTNEEMRKDGTSPYTNGEVPVTVSVIINDDKENSKEKVNSNQSEISKEKTNTNWSEIVKEQEDGLEIGKKEGEEKTKSIRKDCDSVKLSGADGECKTDEKTLLSPIYGKQDGEEKTKSSRKDFDSVKLSGADGECKNDEKTLLSPTYDPLSLLKDSLKKSENLTVSSETVEIADKTESEDNNKSKAYTETPMQQMHVCDVVGHIINDTNYAVMTTNEQKPVECTEKNEHVKGIHRNIVNMQFSAPLHNRQGSSKVQKLFQGKEHSPDDIHKKYRRSSGGGSSITETKKHESKNDMRTKQTLCRQRSDNVDKEVVRKIVEASNAQKRLSEKAESINSVFPNKHTDAKKELQNPVADKPEKYTVNAKVNKRKQNETEFHFPVESQVMEPGDTNVLINKEDCKPNDKLSHDYEVPQLANSLIKKHRSKDTADSGSDKSLLKTAAVEHKSKHNKKGDVDRQTETKIIDSSNLGKNVGNDMTLDKVRKILNESELRKSGKMTSPSAKTKENQSKKSILNKSSNIDKGKIEYFPLGKKKNTEKGKNKQASFLNIFERLGAVSSVDKNGEHLKKHPTAEKINKPQQKSGNNETVKKGNDTVSLVEEKSRCRQNVEKVAEDTHDNTILHYNKEKVKDTGLKADKKGYKKRQSSGENDKIMDKELRKAEKETHKTSSEIELEDPEGNSVPKNESNLKLPAVNADKKDYTKKHSSGENNKTMKIEHRKVVEETNKNDPKKEMADSKDHNRNSVLKYDRNFKLPAVNVEDCPKKHSSGENYNTLKNERREVVDDTNRNNSVEMADAKALKRNSSFKNETTLNLPAVDADKDYSKKHSPGENNNTMKNERKEGIEESKENNPEKKLGERISTMYDNNFMDGLYSLGVEEDDFEPIEIQPCPTPMLPNKEAYNPNLSDISDEERDIINNRKFENTIKYTDDTVLIERRDLDNKRKNTSDADIPVKKQKLDIHHTPHKTDSIKEGRKLQYNIDSPSPRKTNYGARLKNLSKGFDEPLSPEMEIDSPAKSFLKKAKKKIKVPKPLNKQSEQSKISKRTINEIHLETYIQNKSDNAKLVSAVEEQTECQSESKPASPPSPVLQNGFVITYKLTLKDSRQVTTVGHLDPGKLTVQCDVCTKHFSPLQFAEHHDSAEITENIDHEKCSFKNFEPKEPTIILWNVEANKIWEEFLEEFQKEQR